MMNRFIYLVLLTLSTNHASLDSELCTEVNERPGECPAYSITCATPYPSWWKISKHFRCVCDTDCKVDYKCCKDSCYMHDICKPADSIPTTPVSLDWSVQLNRPVTSSFTSQCKEQYPGQCPPYYKYFVTPIPIRLSLDKPYRCKCDSDCKVRYKCCEDSYFTHGVCKPAIRIPTLTGNVTSNSFGKIISGIYTTVNYQEVNLIAAYTSSADKEHDQFSNSSDIYIDGENLEYVHSGENEKVSGVDSYSGSGDFSGDEEGGSFIGSGQKPLKNDEKDDRFSSSGHKEISGSGSIDDEDEEISGSGHGIDIISGRGQNVSVPNNKGSPMNNSDDENEGISGSGHNIISGSGQVINSDNEDEAISGSGHNKIMDIDVESFGNGYSTVKSITEPYKIENTDDDDWEFSGSGQINSKGIYEQISGSGYKVLTSYYAETGTLSYYVENQISSENEHDIDDKYNHFAGSSKKNSYPSNNIKLEDSKLSAPDIETQIHPTSINENTGQYRLRRRQTRHYDLNKLRGNIHRNVKMKKVQRDDF